jgi:hypothetical protein
MSEINLYCEEIIWGNPMPKIMLIQAGKIKNKLKYYKANNNVLLKEKRFGLTIINDPFLVFSQKPIKLFTEKEEENISTEKLLKIYSKFDKFHKEINGSADDMFFLYKSCIEAGYKKEKHGFLGYWLSDFLFKFLQEKNGLYLEKYNFI